MSLKTRADQFSGPTAAEKSEISEKREKTSRREDLTCGLTLILGTVVVSDATGETINSVARACLVQFEGVEPVEHVWSLVRTKGQMEKTLKGIEKDPGPVLFTLVNEALRDQLVDGCRDLDVPCVAVLDPVIHRLANWFGLEISGQPGLQHALDAEYFSRMSNQAR